jgi:hypothetical protein
MADDNPYASPLAVRERATEEPMPSVWRNRLATVGFLISLLFPVIALGSLGALLMEDDFGVVRWRVHRLIRLVLFRASAGSLVAVAVSLLGLIGSPRRLAYYGLILGLMGSSYWVLAMLGILRR